MPGSLPPFDAKAVRARTSIALIASDTPMVADLRTRSSGNASQAAPMRDVQ